MRCYSITTAESEKPIVRESVSFYNPYLRIIHAVYIKKIT